MSLAYLYIRPDLKTIGDFHRKIRSRRGDTDDDWILIAEDVEMQVRPRRPAASSARPEVEFTDIVASDSQWHWARVKVVDFELRNGYRLIRKKVGARSITDDDTESNYLYIIQNDFLGAVQHLLLSDRERSI